MELKFTLFIKFALGIIVILTLFIAYWNKFKFVSKFNFNSIINLLYQFKYSGSFLFPKPC
ncbi:putative membrane protein YukC [Flavobacterium piscis]|uniref:Membrane protein YukC n=1 Tax=Flavobacterium piscis TaxID=1114874 RepID=A0ABU1YDQ1_9FLAO|nr:putative membrane protein YukC [Flavobacterium piscis]